MFSTRVPADLAPNRLARALAAARAQGRAILDLTETNPTRVGLSYPDSLLAPLASPAGLRYEPDPFGMIAAREAVSAEYAANVRPNAGRIVLTASTSEAYPSSSSSSANRATRCSSRFPRTRSSITWAASMR